MDEIKLPYLIYPEGRKGVLYPTYRRDGLLRQLNTPEGERLKGYEEIRKDTRVIAAWVLIHEAFEADHARDETSDPKHKPQWVYERSVAQAVDEWLREEVPSLAPGTQKFYHTYGGEIRAAHGHRPAATMPRDAVVKMVNERRKKTPAAAKNLLAAFQALFSYIEDHPAMFGLSDDWRNPTLNPRGRKGKKGRRAGKKTGWAPWQEWQIQEYRQHWPIGTFERIAFETYLATGQRGSDIVSMRRYQYRSGVLDIIQQKTDVQVWIPVSDDLEPVLDLWLASHDSDYIFPGPDGMAMSFAMFEKRMLKAIRAVTTLPSRCKPHGLRYTFATRAIEMSKIEKRIDYQTIESIVGHRTLTMALQYTKQRRDAQLVVDTINVGTAAYRERHWNAES